MQELRLVHSMPQRGLNSKERFDYMEGGDAGASTGGGVSRHVNMSE